ncbi:hypothetical protein, partial [Streptococcus pneumoniae]|uniref:hypothetical protein n=1 Tax=Streptococcus pneumoniae TaxID=1313 RepID=UPI001E6553E9
TQFLGLWEMEGLGKFWDVGQYKSVEGEVIPIPHSTMSALASHEEELLKDLPYPKLIGMLGLAPIDEVEMYT